MRDVLPTKSANPPEDSDPPPITPTSEDAMILPVLPVRATVLFPIPEAMTPLLVARSASVAAIESALAGDRRLIVLAQQDPLIPAGSLRRFLEPAPRRVEAHWVTGGHVGFPPDLDLGQSGPLGLEQQTLSWLSSTVGTAG